MIWNWTRSIGCESGYRPRRELTNVSSDAEERGHPRCLRSAAMRTDLPADEQVLQVRVRERRSYTSAIEHTQDSEDEGSPRTHTRSSGRIAEAAGEDAEDFTHRVGALGEELFEVGPA